MTRLISLSIASMVLISVSGCGAMLHEMQPHRLWRWNYHSPTGNSDGSYGAYFSLNDSLEKTRHSDRENVPERP